MEAVNTARKNLITEIFQQYQHFLGYFDYQDSNARIKGIFCQPTSTSVEILVETLKKEIKHVVV